MADRNISRFNVAAQYKCHLSEYHVSQYENDFGGRRKAAGGRQSELKSNLKIL